MTGIRLYCGIGETSYNHHTVSPGPYACISPITGRDDRRSRQNSVCVPENTLVIQDSGAFSDGPTSRLSHEDALKRQIEHARKYNYEHLVTHRASYDLLIDETWKDHFRCKQRWTEEAGNFAVKETINAARYLNDHRETGMGCIMSAQGVTLSQYIECTEQILKYVDPSHDMFGLGGWCILGKQPSLLKTFSETIRRVIPILAQHKVQKVHIWGVCYAKALGKLLYLCDSHKIELSTDSIGPSVRPARGQWGYASWINNKYERPEVYESCKDRTCHTELACRGQERTRHIEETRTWLANFKEREAHLYLPIKEPSHKQLSLF